jgi:hypothetical protein
MNCLYPSYPLNHPGEAAQGASSVEIKRDTVESSSDSGVDVVTLDSGGSKADEPSVAAPGGIPSVPEHRELEGESSQANAAVPILHVVPKSKGKGKAVMGNSSGPRRQREIRICGPPQKYTQHLLHVPCRSNSLRIHIYHEGVFSIPHQECHTIHIVTGGTKAVDLFHFHNLKGGPEPSRRLTLHQMGWYVQVRGNSRRWVDAKHEPAPIHWDRSDTKSIWESDWVIVGREAWLTCRCDFYRPSFKPAVENCCG